MQDTELIVEGLVATGRDPIDLRTESIALAFDQRCFGPRKLIVAFAGTDGHLISVASTRRTEPPEAALGPCIEHVGRFAAAAVAFCDEEVIDGPPPPGFVDRFFRARAITAGYGIHLVDWFACDALAIRSSRWALDAEDEPWWDVA